jgi:hypothetical protein
MEPDGRAGNVGRGHPGRPQAAAWVPREMNRREKECMLQEVRSLLLSKGQGQFGQFKWLKIEKKKETIKIMS